MFRIILGLVIAALFVAGLAPTQPVAAQIQTSACATALPPRLYVGGQGQVTPGAPNVLRNQPYRGYDSIVLGEIPALGIFNVVGGPNCFDGMNWWLVIYNGVTGWTPEGANYGVYWTEPVSGGGCMALPSRLIAGQSGRVLPGLPNLLRSQPYRGYDSQVLAQMPANSTFSVVAGPNCSEGMTWWLVSYNGVNGWTPEGQAGQYWLEPFGYTPPPGCNTVSVHMLIGYTGVVSPGVPNRLRAAPTRNGQFLANMPAGTTFTVLGGPTCADGLLWWQVNYRGTVGWTVEGENGQYWLNMLACPGFQTSRLRASSDARVLPGLPNRLRAQASTSSAVLRLIPGGAAVRVIGDPVCSENAAWWRVSYQGVTGWTMEGQGAEYWLEPS